MTTEDLDALVARREELARKAVEERWPRGWARPSKLAALPMVAHAIDLADADNAQTITQLRAENERLRRERADSQYMLHATANMLGPKATEVFQGWREKGIVRVHYSWGPYAAKLTGEERAAYILQWDEAAKTGTRIDNVDAHIARSALSRDQGVG